MYIGVTLKRYRAVKEVGKIKMSVGIITYYQLIQVCQVKVVSYFLIVKLIKHDSLQLILIDSALSPSAMHNPYMKLLGCL